MPFYIQDGESRVYTFDFSRRMSGAWNTGVGYGWHIPAGIVPIASAMSGKTISVQLASATPSYVYTISGYIDTPSGYRLYDEEDVHAG